MKKVNSTWAHVETDIENHIIFIEDISDKTGAMSITNDAENVLKHYQELTGNGWRVVYKDTAGEWWEIVEEVVEMWEDDFRVQFKSWNGLAWDILQR